MSRTITQVSEVWKEYKKGLAGKPAVQQLEKKHKTAWRKDDTEARFFRRRKVIYDEIERIAAAENIPHEDAVRILEEKRRALENTSLDTLMKTITAEKKARKEAPKKATKVSIRSTAATATSLSSSTSTNGNSIMQFYLPEPTT
jgi:hypothetical protein